VASNVTGRKGRTLNNNSVSGRGGEKGYECAILGGGKQKKNTECKGGDEPVARKEKKIP